MRGTLLTSLDRPRVLGDRIVGRIDGRRLERVLWAVVLASVALDVYTTWLGLAMGVTEANPVMHLAFEEVGFAALGGAKCLVVGAAACLRTARPRYGTTIALGLAAPWTLTVLVNAFVLATV
ncbi:MAG: DUF5658 family protein [Halosimplex sp.]